MSNEKRFVTAGAQLRASEGDELATAQSLFDGRSVLAAGGCIVKYNSKSLPNVPCLNARELLMPGVFDDSLASGRTVICDFSHSTSFLPLASTKNRTLRLDNRKDGLYFRIYLDSGIEAHVSIHRLIKAGTLDECSFEFSDPDDEWVTDDEDSSLMLRRIRRCTLHGVTICQRGAYGSATYAQARAMRSYSFPDAAVRRPTMPDAQLRRRVKELGKLIDYENTLDAIKRSEKTGWKQIRTGPGEADFRFEPMTETEYTQHLRRKAERVGEEIREQFEREFAKEEGIRPPRHSRLIH